MPPTPMPVTSPDIVVWTNGCFDIIHAGHVEFLRRCRELGTRLIVGLNSDASVRRLKGNHRPICTQSERVAVLSAIRDVDDVILFDEPTPCEILRRIRPHIIVKGPGYNERNMPESAIVKEWNGQVILLDGPAISTTEIINRILHPRDPCLAFPRS